MKKMYYGIYNGEAEAYRWDGSEKYMLTVSSRAAKDDFMESITGETSGNCFGPSDTLDWVEEFVAENWDYFEDMDQEEELERIEHLSEEWELSEKDLEYLV